MNDGKIVLILLVDRKTMKYMLDVFNLKLEGETVKVNGIEYPLRNVEIKMYYNDGGNDGFIRVNVGEEDDKNE